MWFVDNRFFFSHLFQKKKTLFFFSYIGFVVTFYLFCSLSLNANFSSFLFVSSNFLMIKRLHIHRQKIIKYILCKYEKKNVPVSHYFASKCHFVNYRLKQNNLFENQKLTHRFPICKQIRRVLMPIANLRVWFHPELDLYSRMIECREIESKYI